jgi:hypothetical protein
MGDIKKDWNEKQEKGIQKCPNHSLQIKEIVYFCDSNFLYHEKTTNG